jgi:hypothetical protein
MIMRKGLGMTTTTTIATAAIIIASAMLMMTTTTATTTVYAQTQPENMTATTTTATNATTTTATTNLEFEDEPFAESRITPVSENVINETQQVELVFEGTTTMTLPNTTETITTRDIGEGILTFIPGGGVIHGQLQLTTEDGSESAVALFTEHFNEQSTTAISLVQFIANSTGVLAPLNNMIAITLDQEQPDGSIIIRYFDWEESDDEEDEDDGETEEGGEEGEEEEEGEGEEE